MNNRHKYFRSLRYKQNLEARYDKQNGWHTGVYFITKEPDTRARRECNNDYLRWPDIDHSKYDRLRGHSYYMYCKRPEVAYSIMEHRWGRNGWKKLMKQQTSRRNRRIKVTEDDAAIRAIGYYKKVEDRWNYD